MNKKHQKDLQNLPIAGSEKDPDLDPDPKKILILNDLKSWKWILKYMASRIQIRKNTLDPQQWCKKTIYLKI